MSDTINERKEEAFFTEYTKQLSERKVEYANNFHFICDMDIQSVSLAFSQLRFDPSSTSRKVLSEIPIADIVLPMAIAQEFSKMLQRSLADLEKKQAEGNDKIDGNGEK